MKAVICIVAVSPMRKEAAHRSEMVSQLLFGECAYVLEEEEEDFIRVRGAFDDYEGWCQRTQLAEVNTSVLPTPVGYSANFGRRIYFRDQPAVIPLGSPVYSNEESSSLFGEGVVDYGAPDNLITYSPGSFDSERLRDLALRFVNTAYLWGGKSVFGIDCSGFSQQVFKMLGVPLLRDAYLQADQGESVQNLASANTGDLAFFDNEAGRITHVGILLNGGEIIHAAGRVRIDKIEEGGIYNKSGKRTHRLHSIKRMIG